MSSVKETPSLNENTDGSIHNQNENEQTTNTPFSSSFPRIFPNGTLAFPNNEMFNVNLLNDGFNAATCARRVFTRMMELRCWRCRDGALSSMEDGEVLLFERKAVYTNGRSINVTSGLGGCSGSEEYRFDVGRIVMKSRVQYLWKRTRAGKARV
jgi:hypothetical protein